MQTVRDERMNDWTRLTCTWRPLVANVRTFLKNHPTSVLNESILDVQFFFPKSCEFVSHPLHSGPPGERKQVQPDAMFKSTVSNAIIERARLVIRCVMSRLEDTPLMLSASQTYDAARLQP